MFERLRNWGRPAREQLSFILETADPRAPLEQRIEWLESLLRWIRTAPLTAHEFDTESGALHNARLRFLLQLLDRNPPWHERVGGLLVGVLRDTHAFHLLTRVGLGRERGFIAEALDRIFRRILPRTSETADLSNVVQRVLDEPSDVNWIEGISLPTLERLIALFQDAGGVSEETAARWHRDVIGSLVVLSARIATLGTSSEVAARLTTANPDNPFLTANIALTKAVTAKEPIPLPALLGELGKCRAAAAEILRQLETSGASVSLVYVIDTLQSCLQRVQQLLEVLDASPSQRVAVCHHLANSLAAQSVTQRSLRALFDANIRLVARKVTERTGASGEHYIARNRTEYFSMIYAGIGGGFIMVFTTLNKLFVHGLHLPLFTEFVFYSINYAGSFLLLQALGFTLATKQPSATAAALAAKLEKLREEDEIREFVDEACRMARTQVAALVGNLLLLVPVAIALSLSLHALTGNFAVDANTARSILGSLDPLRSFTLANAVLTGVLLWISSLVAGWVDNSLVYRQVPQAIATAPRIVRTFGAKRAKAAGDFLRRNASLIGGNVSLGVMMGAVSIFGSFFGLPIDVRHVTLSAASLTFAGTTLMTSTSTSPWALVAPGLSVLLIGSLNFAVAYSLAFIVAARSRDLTSGSERRLLRALRARLRRRPLDFLLPRERGSGSTPT